MVVVLREASDTFGFRCCIKYIENDSTISRSLSQRWTSRGFHIDRILLQRPIEKIFEGFHRPGMENGDQGIDGENGFLCRPMMSGIEKKQPAF